MDDKQKIIDKVKKLLALAEGTNFEGETSVAMGKVRDLLAKHNMSMSEVMMDEVKKSVGETRYKTGAGVWQFRLMKVIAEYCACAVGQEVLMKHKFRGRGKNKRFVREPGRETPYLIIFGPEHQVEVVVFMYAFISRQMKSLLRRSRHKFRQTDEEFQRLNKRQRRYVIANYTRGYMFGIIDRLDERLRERLQAENDCRALILVKEDEVVRWEQGLIERITNKNMSYLDGSKEAGYKDGDKITIDETPIGNDPKGELPNGV